MNDVNPTRLGNYRLLAQIGQGGMAEVYKGHHPGLDRLVAIAPQCQLSSVKPRCICTAAA